jgi:hypothetical protein
LKEDYRHGDSISWIDLGKTSFHLVALGEKGKVLLKKKFTQKQRKRRLMAVCTVRFPAFMLFV